MDKLNRICEEKGIILEKVSPAYTSQTCSNCGNIDGKCRKLSMCILLIFIDADLNASININNRGTYSSSN